MIKNEELIIMITDMIQTISAKHNNQVQRF